MSFRRPIFLLLLLILALRIVYVFHADSSPLVDGMVGDMRPYRERAGEILAGDWIGSEVFFDAPLFPYFLALFGAGPGGAELPVRLVHALLGAASAFLVYRITRSFFGVGPALAATLLYGFYGFALFYDGLLLKPPLAVFLLLLSAWLLRGGRGGWAGVSLGAAALLRGNFLFLAPLFLFYAWRHLSRRATAMLLIGVAVPVLIVTVRNAAVGGDFVLLT